VVVKATTSLSQKTNNQKNEKHRFVIEVVTNMSKTASAREEPNSFELFRAPKVFEAKPQRSNRKSPSWESDFFLSRKIFDANVLGS